MLSRALGSSRESSRQCCPRAIPPTKGTFSHCCRATILAPRSISTERQLVDVSFCLQRAGIAPGERGELIPGSSSSAWCCHCGSVPGQLTLGCRRMLRMQECQDASLPTSCFCVKCFCVQISTSQPGHQPGHPLLLHSTVLRSQEEERREMA